jgi:hypothetical protein
MIRQTTVSALYARLNREKFLLVSVADLDFVVQLMNIAR